jgi:predicted DNA-binding ribbon-helix-helix protein
LKRLSYGLSFQNSAGKLISLKLSDRDTGYVASQHGVAILSPALAGQEFLKTMKSAVIKRSIVLNGHKTSVSLENEFWEGLREIAIRENTSLAVLVGQIDHDRDTCNLSSSLRVFVFNHFRARLGAQDTGQFRQAVDGHLSQPALEG